jgi:hypothetical protein
MARRLGLIAAFAAGLLAPLLFVLTPRFVLPSSHQIVRRVSPDEMEDALLIESAALMSPRASYEVRIGKHASPDGVAPAVLTARNAAGLQVRWASPHLLDISYRYAQIDQFTDHWAPCRKCGDTIEIRLLPSPDSFSYQLEKFRDNRQAVSASR